MSALRWLPPVLLVLVSSCANGADTEGDGVITRQGDARADTRGASDDETSPDEDTGENDTGEGRGTDSATDDASAADTEVEDTGVEDTGSEDTGSTDTGPTDTGPTACSGEEPEPNNTVTTARSLGTIDDCDSSGKTLRGVLSSTSDVDVYTFDGQDTFGCSVNPVIRTTGPVRVCMRASCKSGTTELKSCPKGVKSGLECCGGPDVEMEINCTGTASDDARITMTVRPSGTSISCSAYSIAYHY